MTTNLNPIHFSFIRSYLREIKKFPNQITRSYLLNLLYKRCKRPYGFDSNRIQKRILKSLNFLENVRLKVAAANSGHFLMFEELIKESFAVKGQRREKFLKPYLTSTKFPIPNTLTYPQSKFPIYPPILTQLITSNQSNQLRTVPSRSDLKSISPTSLITNIWSDLSIESQPDLTHLGKPKGLGRLSFKRQINHRNRLRNKWINGLIGAPLIEINSTDEKDRVEKLKEMKKIMEDEFGTDLSMKMVVESNEMLNEIKLSSELIGKKGIPRYNSMKKNPNEIEIIKRLNPMIRSISNQDRIPNRLFPSHPFFPKPIRYLKDPIEDLLPNRSKLKPKLPNPSLICLKNGPRRLTQRFLRRRFQSVMNSIPLISFIEPDPHPPPTMDDDHRKRKGIEKKEKKEKEEGEWMIPESRTGRKVLVKRAGVGLGSGRVGIHQMDHEDLIWL
ncbi:hypothetical protein DFH28DRAFT_474190 [Melampsora americana]|nr:hypothetical protein DFH28DRAFT_474190 [Melampsora americana]